MTIGGFYGRFFGRYTVGMDNRGRIDALYPLLEEK